MPEPQGQVLVIDRHGNGRCIYGEIIDLSVLGQLNVRRGSHVEPDNYGKWHADLAPVNGPVLGPFNSRNAALVAESNWLLEYWLPRRSP